MGLRWLPEPAHHEARTRIHHRAVKPAKILVVDDQPINIKLLQRKLEREGYVVQTAYNGLECLDAVKAQRPATPCAIRSAKLS